MVDYPNARENVAYNTTPEESLLGDAIPIRTSSEGLAAPTYGEYADIRDTAFAEIARFLKSIQFPVLDDLHRRIFSEASIGDYRGDRTLDFALSDERMVDVEFVQMIQRSVLAPYPLWRFRIGVVDHDLDVIIYPDALSLGVSLHETIPEAELASWLEAVARNREGRNANRLSQLSVVKERLPRLLPLPQDRPFQVVAVFPFWRDEPNRSTVWLLVPGTGWRTYLVETPEAGHGEYYPVDANGAICEKPARGTDPPYWIEQSVLRVTPPPPEVIVKNFDTGETYQVSLRDASEE